MTEDSLLFIESCLGIRLPASYRALQNAYTDRLQRLAWSDEAINPLYLTAEHVIAPNLEERQPEMGTACAFPNWWESFFLIGTNGGGDYYSLRLDNTEGVWLIGSDCGETPTRVADTLQQYVDHTITEHQAEQAREAERLRQRLPFQAEIDAHLALIASDGGSSSAVEWMTCDAIWPMFEWLKGRQPKVSPRKLRLYGLAICRLIPDLEDDPDCAVGIALAKAMTVDTAAEPHISNMRSRLRGKIEDLRSNYQSLDPDAYRNILWRTNAVYDLFQDDDGYVSDAPIYANDPDLTMVYNAAGYVIAGYPYGIEQAPDLLREVLGNPFHPVPMLPQWRTPEVVNLAQSIFQDERFNDLPELARVLAKAGCVDERILTHCQRPNDHVRGCWVVDAVLEKI
jgi:hypothetical protein